ncbi:hypothetical protein [Mesorhizobium sp.]|uniref:hypothetical protein n=1 Tax=Mesorhizobium sp. TaxID=1871066 RepID=UPI000FE45F41|nr:hypothetical protein [Mesorhizobium sp.]RWM05791.1 MAG: hypothetical protein EOR71_22525 [Mesorhizobium sp.]
MFWAKREERAKTPGGSGGAQATWNTGPVIRIAIAKRRENLVMAWLLADGAAGIKRGFQGRALVCCPYIEKLKR